MVTTASRPPGGLSVFSGDRAYASKREEFEAHLQGVRFLCDGCRRAGVAGLNPWVGDWRYSRECLKPIAVTFKEYDAHFFAGERVSRSLAIHNDTLKARRLTLEWVVSSGRETIAGGRREAELEPGGMAEELVAWHMPRVQERVEVTLSLRLLDGRRAVFREERSYSVFPRRPLAVPAGLRVCLYDPVGSTRAALEAAGAAIEHLSDLGRLEGSGCRLALIGRNALPSGPPGGWAERLREFVRAGGLVFSFEQEREPDWLPVPLRADGGHGATMAFARRPSHPMLAGLREDDLKFWRGDHLVCRRDVLKPRAGAFRIIVDDGGLGGLRWSPLVELPCGKGAYIASQLLLAEKLATEPVAQEIVRNLFRYAAAHRSPKRAATAAAVSQDATLDRFLEAIGLEFDRLPQEAAATDLSDYALVIVGRDDPLLDRPEQMKAFAGRGGVVFIHCPRAGAGAKLRALVPGIEAIKRCRPRGRLRKVRDDGPIEGLSNSDLFWYREDCWWQGWEGAHTGSGMIQNPATWQVLLKDGDAVAFTAPAAVVSAPCGAGSVVINTVRFDEAKPELADKAMRIASTLLGNLGGAFAERS